MKDETEGGASHEIRRALLDGGELTVSEIYAKCSLASSASAVASIMHTECGSGRATRTGDRGSYRYRLTELGLAVAKNPKLAKSRLSRHSNGKRPPPTIVREAPMPAHCPASNAAATAAPAGAPSPAALNLDDPGLRIAVAVLEHWPRGHAIPVELSDRVLETIAHARLA